MPKTLEDRLNYLACDMAGIETMVTMIAHNIGGGGEAEALSLIAKSARSVNDALGKIAVEGTELAKKTQTRIDEQKRN